MYIGLVTKHPVLQRQVWYMLYVLGISINKNGRLTTPFPKQSTPYGSIEGGAAVPSPAGIPTAPHGEPGPGPSGRGRRFRGGGRPGAFRRLGLRFDALQTAPRPTPSTRTSRVPNLGSTVLRIHPTFCVFSSAVVACVFSTKLDSKLRLHYATNVRRP